MAQPSKTLPIEPSSAVELTSLYEGVSVQLKPAPLAKRLMAFAIDMGIVTLLIYALLIGASLSVLGGVSLKNLVPSRSAGIIYGVVLVGFILAVLLVLVTLFDGYFIYFEYRKGATPGKRLFGLKVVSLRQSRLTLGQCMLRELLRYVDCFLIVPGLLSVTLSDRRQRLGDFAASTLVVHSKQNEERAQFLYVQADHYRWMAASLHPQPVPADVRQKFLAFAYREWIQNRRSDPQRKAQWEEVARYYLARVGEYELDQESCLRFFAEYCLQTANQELNSNSKQKGGFHGNPGTKAPNV